MRRATVEARAYRRLAQTGGREAVTAVAGALAAAEQYRPWDGWSLHPLAIVSVCERILRHRLRTVVEFGAGYSTVALDAFADAICPNLHLDSFEHQEEFTTRIRARLQGHPFRTLRHAGLRQVSAAEAESLFTGDADRQPFSARGRAVTTAESGSFRLTNAFYAIDPEWWESRSIDLLIVDGPNGSGRSLAFPLLADQIRSPAWALIDDYRDYPFLSDLERVFEIQVEERVHLYNPAGHDNEYVLVRLDRPRG